MKPDVIVDCAGKLGFVDGVLLGLCCTLELTSEQRDAVETAVSELADVHAELRAELAPPTD